MTSDRAAMRTGSRSFHLASLLLPQSVREPARTLYAFCRAADDLIDNGGGLSAVAALNARLDAVYAGTAAGADGRLGRVVAEAGIERACLEMLLEGFAWDVEGRHYENLPALRAYAMRVAGSVGVMMACIMGVRAPAALEAAADLGCAMQLTNIARDVGEDARAGRLYLPLTWLREAGVDPDSFLGAPAASPAIAGVVRRLLDEASLLYGRGDAGIAALPARCRPAIRAAAALYEAIGTEVARRGCDPVARRAVVPAWRKALVVAHGLPLGRQSVLGRIDDRIGWVLELFARLEAEAEARGMRNGSMS